MAWDRELPVLEEAIRRLSVEYDAFLYGTASKPPVESRKHVDQMIRRLTESSTDSAADRYRFNTLQGRYNALCDRWERLQGEKESGRRPGLYGHFAEGAPASAPGSPAAAPAALRASPNERRPASVREREANPPDRDLFERYLSARRERGENVSGYRYEDFTRGLETERQKLKERFGDADLEFDVVEREGSVRLVARRRRKKGD